MSDVKKAGCCTWCDAEVYEVPVYFPNDSVLAGFPRKIGKAMPIARKITYALRDGSVCDLTSCDACEPNMRDPANFPVFWQKVIRTFLFEERDDVRALLPAPVRTLDDKERILNDINTIANNPPLAVICITSWRDHA